MPFQSHEIRTVRHFGRLPRAAAVCLLLGLVVGGPSGCQRGLGLDADDEEDRAAKPASADANSHTTAREVRVSLDAVQRYGIKVEPVGKQCLAPTFVAPARVSFNAESMAQVGTAVRGRVVELKARLGDEVARGDVLLVVESPDLGEAQSDYLQKRAAVAVADAAVEPARQVFQRGKALHEQGQGIALGEVQKREAECRATQGAAQLAQAALTAAENRLRLLGMDAADVEHLAQSGAVAPRYSLRAPIAGRIVRWQVALGELVAPEKESLLVLADMTTLWVLADVPEAKLSRVAVGQTARVRVSAVADEVFAGTVAWIAAALDADTRTAQVRIVVKDGQTTLKPGMFAEAEITESRQSYEGQPVLAIPEAAVQALENRRVVFVPVAGKEGTFTVRAVEVQSSVGAWTAVVAGLKEGERIVTSGTFILKAELAKAAVEDEDD